MANEDYVVVDEKTDMCESVAARLASTLLFDLRHPSIRLAKMYLRFLVNIARRERLSSEVLFWEHEYYRYATARRHPWWWHLEYSADADKELVNALDMLSKRFSERLRLADIGSGPVTSFSEKIDTRKWDIVSVDPLADIYNRLNDEYGVESPRCVRAFGETLTSVFDRNSFHLVLSQNAIDHSESPCDFASEMVSITKPGGLVCFYGFIKKGTADIWLGLHKWDIELVGNDLLVSNKDRSIFRQVITDRTRLEPFCLKLEGNNPDDKYVAIYEKKA